MQQIWQQSRNITAVAPLVSTMRRAAGMLASCSPVGTPFFSGQPNSIENLTKHYFATDLNLSGRDYLKKD